MLENKSYADLLEACAQPGCPVCQLSIRSVRRYLDGILYEGVNDPGIRRAMRKANGLCNEHGWWLLEGLRNNLGVAILHQDILLHLAEALETTSRRQPQRGSQRDLVNCLSTSAECPACAQRRTMEEIVIQSLVEHLDDDELQTALVNAGGLCLLHLRCALERANEPQRSNCLVQVQLRCWSHLTANLSEFIRKHDYRFRDEPFGAEADSARRAIAAVCGERGVR